MTMEADLERAIKAIGESYDGYTDRDDTPNNWDRAVAATRSGLLAFFRSREPSPEEVEVCAARAGESKVDPKPNNETRVGDWLSARDIERLVQAVLLAHAEYMVKVLETPHPGGTNG